jgi:PAS domain S-box-containing protein
MPFQFTPYTIPLVIAVVVSAVGAGIAWYQREGLAEIYAMWIHVALALWPLTMLLTLSVTSLGLKKPFLLLFVPTVPLLVISCLLFVFHFTGRPEWDTPRRRQALAAFPALTLVLSVTNGAHELVFVNPQLDTSGSFVQLTYGLGPGLYGIVAISGVLVATYLGLTIRKFFRSRNVYRNLSFIIALGFITVTGAFFLSVVGLSPLPHFVLAPLAYVVVGGVLILGTSSVRFIRRLPIDRVLSVAGSRFDSSVPLARDFIVQEVENGIIVLDAEDRVVDINATAKRMLGLDRPVGKHLLDVTRPDWILEGGELRELLENEAPIRELDDEVWVHTPEGERCYDVSISALTDDGETVAHVVLIHDITDQKEREERLEEQTEELEFQKRQLERQNERLDRFASIVSHDLRNPLNIVDGHLELLESAKPDGADEVTIEAEQVDRMQQATERMSAIIDDALTLARQGKAITDTATVDLETVVADAWGNVDTAAATLESRVDASIVADRDRLLNVFENLFRNSIEHGGEDVTVTVGLLQDRDGFYVADDGPGIPDDEKESVLEHGYTTSADGTGLGLSIVTDIARAHGWTVEVTDSESGGARFEITEVRLRPDATGEDTAVAEQ